MSQWQDRIKNHQVWQQLDLLGPAIDQAVSREGIDPDSVVGLERLRTVLAFIGKRLAAADQATTITGPLDGIAVALQNATAEVTAFVTDGVIQHVAAANTHGDGALSHLAQVAVPTTPKELAGLKDAATSYRATLEELLKKATSSVEVVSADGTTIKSKLAELGNEVAAERQRLAQLSSDFQSQFSTAQETRNRDYTEAQGTRQEKFQALLTEFTDRLATENADFTKRKEEALKDYDAYLETLKVRYADSAQAILAKVENHRKDIEKLVGVIGNLGVTSGYLKTANYARRALWFWQAVTVAALGGVVYIAYKEFLRLDQGTFSWEVFASRAFLCLTVGVLAAYAGSQADKYIRMELRNRRLALELEAIGPYLAPLPQDKQEAFRLEVGARTFGTEEDIEGKHGGKSPATVVDVLSNKGVRELLIEVVKAIRQG